jgi:hypothetical protein
MKEVMKLRPKLVSGYTKVQNPSLGIFEFVGLSHLLTVILN